MLNFGASKPRVRGGARAPGAPPGSAPDIFLNFCDFLVQNHLISACKQSCRKVMFLHLSVSHSVHGGVHGKGWQGVCMVGGHVAGGAWKGRACRRDGHGQYASYWNAFLFSNI